MKLKKLFIAASIPLSILSCIYRFMRNDIQFRGFPINFIFINLKDIDRITQNPLYTLITRSSFDVFAFFINCYIYYFIISKIYGLIINKKEI